MRGRGNGQFLQKYLKFSGDHGLFGSYAATRVMGGPILWASSLFPTFTSFMQVVNNFTFYLDHYRKWSNSFYWCKI